MPYRASHALSMQYVSNILGEGPPMIQEETEAFIRQFRTSYPDAADAIDENGDSEGMAVWDDAVENLTEFSKRFPEILFTLEVEGSEHPDLWKAYFRDGTCQRDAATVTYEGPDMSMLADQKVFEMTVGRTVYASATLRIRANTAKEAHEAAMRSVESLIYGNITTDYQVEHISITSQDPE